MIAVVEPEDGRGPWCLRERAVDPGSERDPSSSVAGGPSPQLTLGVTSMAGIVDRVSLPWI